MAQTGQGVRSIEKYVQIATCYALSFSVKGGPKAFYCVLYAIQSQVYLQNYQRVQTIKGYAEFHI